MENFQQYTMIDEETGLAWYAVRTFFRREKHVNKLLDLKGVDAWVPLREKTRIYTRKIRKVQLPLISQYVFVNINERDKGKVLQTEGVIGFVKPSGYIVPIPKEEIDLLKRVIGEEVEVEMEEGQIQKGDRVEIIGGELTGLRGHMVERRGKNKVAVNMEHFQHAILMEIPLSALRKI
jgi:transcription antitermination factor NusG